MNDEDRAALAAWRDYRDAEDMAKRAETEAYGTMATHANGIVVDTYATWLDALNKAAARMCVATLKGGR